MLKAIVAALAGFVMSAGAAMAQCTVPNTLTNGTNADATQVMANFNAVLTCLNGLPTATPVMPQGRLTLQSVTPVMTTSQSGKTVIYYTSYSGNRIPIYNGTVMIPTAFSELANITTNGATGNAGPAAVANNGNYDLFVWNNGGTPTLTRGPAWTSDTARGTGPGTSELQMIGGYWTNKNAITNGPAANLGTYVGTVRSDGSAQINFTFGGVTANGTQAILGVWNVYNRVTVRGFVGDNSASWSSSTAAWQAAHGSNSMRVSYVLGLAEEALFAEYGVPATTSGSNMSAGIGYDTTSAMSGRSNWASATGVFAGYATGAHSAVDLGFHYMQAIEYAFSGTVTWWGTGGSPINFQSGLRYEGRF